MEVGYASEQIERILHSRTFARKAQLRKLLELLLRNSDSGLTPDQVIQELWPSETRTKRAADVATEMNRLRHALRNYYETEGASDPVVITLPNRGVTSGSHERPWIELKSRSHVVYASGEDQDPALKSRTRQKVGMVVGLAAVIFAVATYFVIRTFVVLDQPKFGRLEGSSLIITDANGKELWRKLFAGALSPDWYSFETNGPYLLFVDLEGKGHTSVLFSYSPGTPWPHSTTVICYSDTGKEKWRWLPGRDLPELNGSPATYLTHSLGILKASANRPVRIVATSQQHPWWPSQIALLDSHGKTVSEYWHSGGLSSVVADLDGDGKQEIVATGVSEYDHQATLVVLDSDRVFGASKEVRPGFQIHGMGEAKERLRLLFPRSDLNRALYQYSQAYYAAFEHDVFRVNVAQCINATPECPIWYEFDKNFNLMRAYAGGDAFRSAHNRYFQTGKDAHMLSPEEEATFQKVQCLVGCKTEFVPVAKAVTRNQAQ